MSAKTVRLPQDVIVGMLKALPENVLRVDRPIRTYFHAFCKAAIAARSFARRLARDWILFFTC